MSVPLGSPDHGETHVLDPRGFLAVQIDRATADGRLSDALMLSLARDAIDLNETVMAEVRAHRFDTEHLIERYAAQGQKFSPRLADQMLYEATGLDRVAVQETEPMFVMPPGPHPPGPTPLPRCRGCRRSPMDVLQRGHSEGCDA